MKTYAYIILAVVFLSLILVPLLEVFFVFRDRMVLNAALANSFRVARDMSLMLDDEYYDFEMGAAADLDAIPDVDRFLDYFAKTLGLAIGAPGEENYKTIYEGDNECVIEFDSTNFGDNAEVSVTFIGDTGERSNEHITTTVEISVDIDYLFKTALLNNLYNNSVMDTYKLETTRSFRMRMLN